MVYKGSNETYDFRKFKRISVSGNEIRNIINMSMTNINKTSFSDVLMTLKVRQDHKLLSQKK